MPYIYWEIVKINGVDIVRFYLEPTDLDLPARLVYEEELENVIGDFVDQREDEWVEER